MNCDVCPSILTLSPAVLGISAPGDTSAHAIAQPVPLLSAHPGAPTVVPALSVMPSSLHLHHYIPPSFLLSGVHHCLPPSSAAWTGRTAPCQPWHRDAPERAMPKGRCHSYPLSPICSGITR